MRQTVEFYYCPVLGLKAFSFGRKTTLEELQELSRSNRRKRKRKSKHA